MMIIGPAHITKTINNTYITIGDNIIVPSKCVRNIGAVLDDELCMAEQINSICKSCYASLNSLGRIRKYLTDDATEMLVHAFVTCKLDTFNSLLSGVPKYLLERLQLITNSAARIVTRTKKYDHITHVRKQLHWLPVESRITF